MKIFLLAGYAGSGKTTACKLLERHVPSACTTAFATAVKDQVAELYAFDRRLCDSPNGKLSAIATDTGRKTVRELLIEHSAKMKWEHGNSGYWADLVVEEIQKCPYTCNWIIHDWRYKREIQVLRVAFPEAQIITMRIVRDSVIPLSDPSEHDLDDFAVDHVIKNNGSQAELEEKLKALIE